MKKRRDDQKTIALSGFTCRRPFLSHCAIMWTLFVSADKIEFRAWGHESPKEKRQISVLLSDITH